MSDSTHVICPACSGVNRTPVNRLRDAPKCGKCSAALFTGQPVELTAANFDRHIQRSDVPLVVDFWAAWCGPCKMMAPAFAEAAAELEPEVRLAKLNTEEAPELAGKFGIRGIPTMILFAGGRERARQSGAMGKPDIVRWIRSALPHS